MFMWGNFSSCVCKRDRKRDTVCVCHSYFGSFFITDTKRQIKKLYSNWYDQAEHLSQISNIKIQQLTRLRNKAGPFCPILCLICWERDGAGAGWTGLDRTGPDWTRLDAPPGTRCTI